MQAVLDQVKWFLLLFSVFVAFLPHFTAQMDLACCAPYSIQLRCPNNKLSFNTPDMEINLSNSQLGLWRMYGAKQTCIQVEQRITILKEI